MSQVLPIAKNNKAEFGILAKMANRHGLITGATGTGKTVTLQVLAEAFSKAGVPVFAADIKGDLSGISAPGVLTPKMQERLKLLDVKQPQFAGCPVQFWDVYGEQGHPVRATISDMGPLMLARILDLNDTQEAVLSVTFKIADDKGLLLLDLKDLRSMLQHVSEHAKEYASNYGNISPTTVATIQRNLLSLESQGGTVFFGEPALRLEDLMRIDASGKGVVNVFAADKLMQSPKLYATFLLWLLSELFEQLPEAGDLEKPKLVFFFDEAHLLFNDAPKPLLEKIEQVVRLIRSKGVGIYFVTQNPLDVPETVLGQLGNRVQHALRAFTPRDQKAVKAAATTFRQNKGVDTEKVIIELGVGEALVSFLDERGMPLPVERVFILPPAAQIGPITSEQRKHLIRTSLSYGRYESAFDRESAYELLKDRAEKKQEVVKEDSKRKSNRQSTSEAFMKSAARAVGSQLGQALIRGLLGSLKRK